MYRLLAIIWVCCCGEVCKAQQVFEEPLIKTIYFGGGSYYVDEEQRDMIYHFLDSIPDIEYYQITLNSHTDSIGGFRYNQWLSQMRNQSVLYLLLKSEKLSKEMIDTQDFGLQHPLYTNQTWMGRQSNRRVDIIIWPLSQ